MTVSTMRRFLPATAAGLALCAATGVAGQTPAQQVPAPGPYHVQKTAKVGGEGGFDYVYADADGRRLYIARSGPAPRATVFDLDTTSPFQQPRRDVGYKDAGAHQNHSGNKSCDRLPLREVQPVTGYLRGGVSPLGTKKRLPVYLDCTALAHSEVIISAGVRGTQMLLAPADLVHMDQGDAGRFP